MLPLTALGYLVLESQDIANIAKVQGLSVRAFKSTYILRAFCASYVIVAALLLSLHRRRAGRDVVFATVLMLAVLT
jgi:hypothetical protein